ncbi:MAG: tyrosine-type recombinase/integrase [Solirubrobacteraceae bacterium]
MSVERVPWETDLPWRVRWRQDGHNRSRSFATKKAADRFDRRVKDLRASGELHLLDEEPRGTMTLYDYTYDVWWPEYAEVNLTDETRASYATQLDLRIIPKWGKQPLRTLEPGPIEGWVSKLRKAGVGDATVLKTLTVFRAILKRAERDREIDRNPIPLVAKPKQKPKRAPRPIAPYLVERMRALMLKPPPRLDKRGRRIPARDPLLREMDAMLVSVLAYSGPRPESEALPLAFEQVGRRTITFRATKSGVVVERETRLLEPLARDLRRWRLRCPPSEHGLVFPSSRGDQWTGDDWDNWRERIFQPAAIAVGLPKDTRPRDLRGSFASLLIYEGIDVVELAPELGHSPATCLRYYARVFEEFKGLAKCPAVDVIREARKAVAAATVPPRYLRDDAGGVGAVWTVGGSAS